jgi:nitroreductase
VTQPTPDHIRFLRRLRAVREYTPEPVAEQALQEILEVGRWTSTGGNRQPTEVIVVRDAEVRRKFGEWGARPAASAPLVLLLVSNSDAATFDEGRMAERLALAAAAHGLGSVIATLKNEGPDETKKLLGIPDDKRARTVVTIGHIDQEARRALPPNPQGGRKPVDQYAHQERY